MAITAPTVQSDLSGFITPEQSEPIFERAARQSVVQQLVQRVPLGPSGVKIPVITGRPTAGWVGEGETKPASAGAMTSKTITPQKLAAIMVTSAEVARLNPAQFVTRMQGSLAETFAVAFDYATLHDLGPDGTGTGPFSTYIDQTTKTQALGATAQANGGIYGDFASALQKVVTDKDASGRRYRLTGWALDDIVEPALIGATTTTGQPLFVEQPLVETAGPTRAARLMSRPAFMGEGVATADGVSVVGYGGDWSQAAWGAIGGINYRISTEATVTINGSLVSLWQNNLVAILAEAEYGWIVNDAEAFVKVTNTDNSPVTSS